MNSCSMYDFSCCTCFLKQISIYNNFLNRLNVFNDLNANNDKMIIIIITIIVL